MKKQLKYIFVLCLVICVFLVGCGEENVENNEQPGNDDIIYAPVDTTEDEQINANESDEAEKPEDSDVTEPAVSGGTSDTAETTEESEPPETPDDTETDTQPAETDSVTDPSEDVTVIKLGEDFLTGESAVGSLISRQSDKIRLVVSYDCKMNADGCVTVALEVGLESYDINCGGRVDGGKLSVNGDAHTFSTDEIIYEESGMIYTPFTTYVYQAGADETACSIDASWFFNGVYAGVKIDTLTLEAIIEWSTNS